MKQLIAWYEKCINQLAKIGWLPPLLARIVVGYVFAESGWGKIHNIDKVAGFFASLNLPAPEFQAYLVAYTELIAGAMLVFGFATRAAATALAFTMLVAIIKAKAEDIHAMSDLFGMSEFLYIVIFIWLIVEGAGAVSIDRLRQKRIKIL